MALSNWDTLAVEFEIIENKLSVDNIPAAQKIQKEIQAMVDTCGNDPEKFNELMDNKKYVELVNTQYDLLREYEVSLKESDGTYCNKKGDLKVRIYKNWVYLSSESMWTKSSQFMSPTFAEVQSCDMRTQGLYIDACRCPQEGVFTLTYNNSYEKNEHGLNEFKYTGMCGVGVYGYEDSEWTGVNKETMNWLKDKLASKSTPDFCSAIDLSNVSRFNQGDAYFAKEFGIFTPKTSQGESDEPIISEFFKED